MSKFFKNLFLHSVGHTYSNLSRLFLRLFTGVMFLHLCFRQMLNFDTLFPTFDGFLGLSPQASMSVMLVLEVLCATFIILGFLTRLAVLPPLVIMCIAENMVFGSQPAAESATNLFNFAPGYPVMFIGIFCYLLLAGPGKISLDYVISAYLADATDEDAEILDNA